MHSPHPPRPCWCEVCPVQRSRTTDNSDNRSDDDSDKCPWYASGSTPQMPLQVGRNSAIMGAQQRLVGTFEGAAPGWCGRSDATCRFLVVAEQPLSGVKRETASYVNIVVPDFC
jgi:hypothetical protein